MFPRLCARRLRGILALLALTGGFILMSSQFRNIQSDAKSILPEPNSNLPQKPRRVEPKLGGEAERKDQVVIEPMRGDIPEQLEVPKKNDQEKDKLGEIQREVIQPPAHQPSDQLIYIENERYPKLNEKGKFIPQRRIIHLDLKGAPYKVEFFTELFYFFKRIRATGILLEWEDMFPYTGKLSEARNGDAYSLQDVETILTEAKRHKLEIIPLVQTFGHLEWILKLEKFAHLREDKRYPQVICFPKEEAWNLIQEMVDQVAAVHSKYNMNYFHMGADEAFQVGFCNESISKMNQLGSKERLMLWHMSRTAKYIKEKYKPTVLAWHDMIVQVPESDLSRFGITTLLEPVLWSYAEDLDMYLPRSTWMALKPFRKVWGSSAWKGADGPGRYNSNPVHYIKNHEAWTEQFSRIYEEFDVIQGLIMTGWSRYDHLATICELLPVGIPAMTMGMETILEGQPLRIYSRTEEELKCNAPTEMGYAAGCRFPGSKIYELVNSYWSLSKSLRGYRDTDYELNGWLSRAAEHHTTSSHWYIDKVLPMIQYHASRIREVEKGLRQELSKIYFQNTIDEFIYVYMGEDIEWLSEKLKAAERVNHLDNFPKRPQAFPKTEL